MYIRKLTQHSATRKSWSLLSFALDRRIGISSTSTSQHIQWKISLSDGRYWFSSCRTGLFSWALGEWLNLRTPPRSWVCVEVQVNGPTWPHHSFRDRQFFLACAWGVRNPLDGSIPLSIFWPARLLRTRVCFGWMEGAMYRKDPLRDKTCMKQEEILAIWRSEPVSQYLTQYFYVIVRSWQGPKTVAVRIAIEVVCWRK